MNFQQYFQSMHAYFWQWEDDNETIAVPHSATIVYTNYAMEILEALTPQGVPPFGALLLANMAINRNGEAHILDIFEKLQVRGSLKSVSSIEQDLLRFLTDLSNIPETYKSGENRLLLLQTIFEDCHNRVSPEITAGFWSEEMFVHQRHASNSPFVKIPFDLSILHKDFGTIQVMSKRFPTTDAIVKKMLSLPSLPPNLPPETLDLDANNSTESPKDFITELTDDSETFFVGALIKHLWSGLNMPVHSALPSQQPLGGVSDLTNKGDFDRLLISEFANDDLIFLSRIANNEALYIRREVPPENNNLERIFLLDVSLKN